MSTYPDHILRLGSQHLAELKRKAAEFERQLWDAHDSLEYEVTRSIAPERAGDQGQEVFDRDVSDRDVSDQDVFDQAAFDEAPGQQAFGQEALGQEALDWQAGDMGADGPGGAATAAAGNGHGAIVQAPSPEERTAGLASHGRHPARRRHRVRRVVLAAMVTAALTAAVTVLALIMTRPSPAWPASVAEVEHEIATACQNADVQAEPSQVNFACGRGTRQILWVFSLLTSGDNPDYASIKTGRQGLEPITPAQGGEVAWSLNLHHPYNPANPVDSLEVAARAINNIIGGATLTAANGKPVVQPGLESIAANCARYTGSGAVTTRNGFPDLCAKPISTAAGQAALVADVFQKWVVGAPPSRAQDAAVLFQNSQNPGDPRVLAILRSIQARFAG